MVHCTCEKMFYGSFAQEIAQNVWRNRNFCRNFAASLTNELFEIMKTSAFLAELRSAGCCLRRHGSGHDLWFNPKTGRQTAVPRHRELGDFLARKIRCELGL